MKQVYGYLDAECLFVQRSYRRTPDTVSFRDWKLDEISKASRHRIEHLITALIKCDVATLKIDDCWNTWITFEIEE